MLNNITLGQFFPGESFIHKMDPRAKIIAATIFIASIFVAESYWAYGLIIAFTFFCIYLTKLPVRLLWKAVKPLWIIIVFTMLIHVFTTPGTVIWKFHFLEITEEGLIRGTFLTTRLVFLILFSSLLTYTTSPIVLTDGIEQLLNPFKRIGVPAHELAMMMTIALRFIPTLLEETDRIMKAQAARGADFMTGSLMKRAKNMIPILVPLFISAFRRADDLATAMEARCYRGGENRTRLHKLLLTWRDYVGIAVVVVVALALIGLRFVPGINMTY